MRILIGLTDVANVTANYARGFQALGHETFTVVWSRSRFYPDEKYNLIIDERLSTDKQGDGILEKQVALWGPILRLLGLPIHALTCDLFIMFAPAVLPTYLYYPILTRLGKRIVTVFWGSDIRYWYAFAEEMHQLGVSEEISHFIDYVKNRPGGSYFDKLRTVQVAERYSDLILSQPDCGQLQTRPYMRANIPLELSQFCCRVPDREVPLVLHAPSVRGAKGTEYVLAAVEQLRGEGIAFDFRLIENMPNAELKELLTESDIVVDELFSSTVGGLSTESMATGNVALVRYDSDYCKVPPGCPALNVNMYTVAKGLREVVQDRDLRRRLACAGRPYVEANNDHVRVTRQILDWLAPGGIKEFDFVPTFHNSLAIPGELVEAERNASRIRRKQFFQSLWLTGSPTKS